MKITKKFISLVLALLMILPCISITGFAEETEGTEHLTEVPEGYVGIFTKEDLLKIHYDTKGKYILMNDIIFEDNDFNETYNDGNGWIPYPEFSGVFDGNSYKISNLRISGDISNVGLFSSLTETAKVKNLFIENIDIDVTGDNVGGICGSIVLDSDVYNDYIISNCVVSGNIFGGNNVSGFCGYVYILAENDVNLINQSCNASIVSGSNYVGGFIGYHKGGAEYFGYIGSRGSSCNLEKCINTGSINGDTYIGGVVGLAREHVAQGTYGGPGYGGLRIRNTFNVGDITGEEFCGGIIGGENWAEKNNQIVLSNCYNVGTVMSNKKNNFGAIIGTTICEISNVYYLNQCVADSAVNKGDAVTADKLKLTNMGENWTFEGRTDYFYPELIGVTFIFPHSHKYVLSIILPTCTEQGYTTYTCECGDSYIADYVDATGHSHTAEVTTPATHTATGVMTYTCNCGDTYTEIIGKIAEHNHNAVVTAPTCTEKGYTTYTCECGDSYVDDYVPEKGHDEGVWSVTKPSTPTESGVMHLFCGECGFVLETKVIPATGKVRGVAISDISLDYKASTTITPSITVDSGVKYTVTYSSSNPSVASVDANGKVVAGKTGSATITVTVTDEFGNTVSDTCTVKVNYNWWQWIIVIVLFGWIWY